MSALLNGNAGPINPVVIKGRGIGQRRLSRYQRAKLAVAFQTGAARGEKFSLKQSAAITGASVADVFMAKYGRKARWLTEGAAAANRDNGGNGS